ncbi:hypothetical protein Hypma_002871 [Hypsizygus marmoreus]|uniref:F-box domain-containing protein n=1 Tax=Hypsizygus marmoreus TaxID=39966 RepID=A0A369J9S1_HYPMA|nr:hypothetical protein Hypma_002871 [Hypsizygus marmoreus]
MDGMKPHSEISISASAFSSQATRGTAYARIKHEIEASEAVIREWKGHHNRLSLISRLPPEILSIVFKCVAEAFETAEESENHRWVGVSHVCKHWRQVALQCPSLWSTIFSWHPRWTKEVLARSQMSPLTVKATIQHPANGQYKIVNGEITFTNQTSLLEVLQHLSRIRVLSILQIASARDLVSHILDKLDAAAPLLQTLIIVSHQNLGEYEYNVALPYAELPATSFPHGAPLLRTLELRLCSLPWDSPLLTCDLTSLTLSRFPPDDQVSIQQIIAILCGLPNLETLELTLVIISSPSRAAIPAPPKLAHLPRLTSLHIEADIFSCACLLSHMDYPVLIRNQVVWTCSSILGTDFASTSSSFHELSRNLLKGLKGSISCLRALGPIGFQVWDSLGEGRALPRGSAQIVVERSLYGNLPARIVRQAMTEMWSVLPLHNLKTLYIENLDMDRTVWAGRFASLQSLENLCVRRAASVQGLLDVLSGGTEDFGSGNAGDDCLAFRSLRHLMIIKWNLDDQDGSRPPQTCLGRLVECLEERRKRGRVLHEIHIEHCVGVNSQAIGELAEVVDKVDWDELRSFSAVSDVYGTSRAWI